MVSSDRYVAPEPIINIDILKASFPAYYNLLNQDELQPYKIILCSNLSGKKEEAAETIILLYNSEFIMLKNVTNGISKHKLLLEDVNFLVNEGVPHSYCIVIDYKHAQNERIYYDSKVNDLVRGILTEFRIKLLESMRIDERSACSELAFSDMELNKYPGAAIAKSLILDENSVLCSLMQRKVHNHPGLLFSKVVTNTHFTVVCKREIIIFMERSSTRVSRDISGDLIHIPLRALRNISIEATGKGMLLKYLFNSNRKLELFYENQSTEQLLKIMSYVNSLIAL